MVEYIKGDLPSDAGRSIKLNTETKHPCPMCNKEDDDGNNFMLYIKLDSDGTTTLECKNCFYITHMLTDSVRL